MRISDWSSDVCSSDLHTEFVVTAAQARDTIPDLAAVYDEPFADPSAIPTMQLARLARSKVTVCLSGDGGAEFFGGYGRYALATRLGDGIDSFPRWLRGLAGHGLTGLPVRFWDAAPGRPAGRWVGKGGVRPG